MQTRTYKSGSIIYFLGDKAEKIFLLKDGTLQSIFISTDTGKEDRKTITAGNFFSVKSVMGMHTQEETIQCLSDCSVIIFTLTEFEELVSKNTSVLIKILRIFSDQYKDINKKLDSIFDTDRKESKPNVQSQNKKDALNMIGEYFYKNKRYKEAFHAFRKYIKTANPESTTYTQTIENMKDCMKALNISESDLETYDEKADKVRIEKAKEVLESDILTTDGKFRKANNLSVLGDFSEAIELMRELVKSEDNDVFEKSSFYLGKYLYYNKEYDEALSVLTEVTERNQLSEYSKEASLYLGKIHSSNSNNDEAIKYYNKVINIPPIDRLTMEAKKEYDSMKGRK